MAKKIFQQKHILLLSAIVIIAFLSVSFLKHGTAGCTNRVVSIFSDDSTRIQNPVYQVPIPVNIDFAGEAVPLNLFDVRESLDRELQVNTYWHSQTVLLLKRANRYFPVIEPILNEMGVPDDFKYLAVAESALTQAVSPSQAVGFWQILEGTGKELGLEINDEVDERYHIEKSTYAACKFLLKSYKKYGNWTMAAASYNFGRNGIQRQMERQDNTNYYDMVLGEETGRYVYRIIAFKAIFENPQQYGFHLKTNELYPPIRFFEVEVDSTVVSFAQFAKTYSTSYKMLKLLNPWLRESYLTNKEMKKYTIKIPNPEFRENAYDN
jgi:hypothetical protein